MPRIFISYSHSDDGQEGRVRNLAADLRQRGLEVVIDQDALPGGPNEGWDLWAERQFRAATHILVACTKTYCRRFDGDEKAPMGRGTFWEAGFIRDYLYGAWDDNKKVRAILFSEADYKHIPVVLKRYHRYPLHTNEGHRELVGWLTGKPVDAPRIEWPKPAPFGWDMANRKGVTARIDEILEGPDPKPILFIRGESNSGKTHFLAELERYARRIDLAYSRQSFKGGATFNELIWPMFEDLGVPGVEPDLERSRVTDKLGKLRKTFLLMFDCYEQAPHESQEWIENHFLSGLGWNAWVVIAGQQVPKNAVHPLRAGEHLSLGPILEVNDWLEFGSNKWRGSRLNYDHVESLTLATGGNPGLLSSLLGNAMSRLGAKASA